MNPMMGSPGTGVQHRAIRTSSLTWPSTVTPTEPVPVRRLRALPLEMTSERPLSAVSMPYWKNQVRFPVIST